MTMQRKSGCLLKRRGEGARRAKGMQSGRRQMAALPDCEAARIEGCRDGEPKPSGVGNWRERRRVVVMAAMMRFLLLLIGRRRGRQWWNVGKGGEGRSAAASLMDNTMDESNDRCDERHDSERRQAPHSRSRSHSLSLSRNSRSPLDGFQGGARASRAV